MYLYTLDAPRDHLDSPHDHRDSSGDASSLGSAEAPTLLINGSTALPGSHPTQHFVALGGPTARAEWVAFVGAGQAGLVGVYRLSLLTLELRKVADTATALPRGGGSFSSFTGVPAVSIDGTVIFFAVASDPRLSGFYVWGTGTAFAPAAVATMASSHASYMIMHGGDAADGSCLAFYAVLDDGHGEVDALLSMRPPGRNQSAL
mgnify:CR=1 FL=1|jgi:hypothetical protein